VPLNHARQLPQANAARFAQAYNEAADRLALVPATAKRAEGAAFEARLDRSGATAADMVTADLKVLAPACCPAFVVPRLLPALVYRRLWSPVAFKAIITAAFQRALVH